MPFNRRNEVALLPNGNSTNREPFISPSLFAERANGVTQALLSESVVADRDEVLTLDRYLALKGRAKFRPPRRGEKMGCTTWLPLDRSVGRDPNVLTF